MPYLLTSLLHEQNLGPLRVSEVKGGHPVGAICDIFSITLPSRRRRSDISPNIRDLYCVGTDFLRRLFDAYGSDDKREVKGFDVSEAHGISERTGRRGRSFALDVVEH